MVQVKSQGLSQQTDLFVPKCLDCRYDLTGLPDGRCPECGEGFSHAALLALHEDRLREKAERRRKGLRLLGWFVYSCVFASMVLTYREAPMVSMLGFACLLAIAAWVLVSDIRGGRKSIATGLLFWVALIQFVLGVAITVQSFPLFREGYRWTDMDIPTVRGWRWLDPATGCVLGLSMIAIALGIWAGLWRLMHPSESFALNLGRSRPSR